MLRTKSHWTAVPLRHALGRATSRRGRLILKSRTGWQPVLLDVSLVERAARAFPIQDGRPLGRRRIAPGVGRPNSSRAAARNEIILRTKSRMAVTRGNRHYRRGRFPIPMWGQTPSVSPCGVRPHPIGFRRPRWSAALPWPRIAHVVGTAPRRRPNSSPIFSKKRFHLRFVHICEH